MSRRLPRSKGSAIWPPIGAGVLLSPRISVVTPWVTFERERRSVRNGMIECDWMSMKPGQTTCPVASITSATSDRGITPAGATHATRPFVIATTTSRPLIVRFRWASAFSSPVRLWW